MQTSCGKPLKINRVWFRARYGAYFPDLLPEDKDELLDSCIDDVYTMFYGVAELWEHMERSIYENKTQLCYGLLTAWYITDVYPQYTVGVVSTGGIPVKSKKIGGVSIQFGEDTPRFGAQNNADLLHSLKSNPFGAKAYMMIKASGKLNLFLKR